MTRRHPPSLLVSFRRWRGRFPHEDMRSHLLLHLVGTLNTLTLTVFCYTTRSHSLISYGFTPLFPIQCYIEVRTSLQVYGDEREDSVYLTSTEDSHDTDTSLNPI